MPAKLSSLLALALILLAGQGLGDPDWLSGRELRLIPNFSDTWKGRNIERELWVAKGRSILLKCQFATFFRDLVGSYDVKWYKSNNLLTGRRFVITKSGDLNITRVRRRGSADSDAGEYRCVVNAKTDVPTVLSSPSVRLIIADIRSQRSPVSVISAHEGGSVRIKCQINSQPEAVIRWRKGDKTLPQNDRIIRLSSGVLQINKVQMSDSDKYKCIATNLVINKTKEYEVKIEVVPTILDSSFISPTFLSPNLSNPVIVPKNGTAVFECVATGVPSPTLSWEFKSTKDDWKKMEDIAGKNVFINEGILQISSVSSSHIGIYRCTASSTNPNTGKLSYNTQETKLQVDLPPVMVPGTRNVTTLIGKTTRLNCSLHGESKNSHHRIIWYKDGQILEPDSRIAFKKPNQLIFVNSIIGDSGIYQCMAINQAGFSTTWTYFLVNSSKDRPNAPTNLRCILYNPTSVMLSWNMSGPVDAFSIHYTVVGKNSTEKQRASYNTSFKLDGLKANTEYDFRVRAYKDTPSDMSENVTFRTAEDIPKVMPEFDLNVKSPTSVNVYWNPLTTEDARGKITGYKIIWKRRTKDDYYNVNGVGADVFHHVLKGLHPGKTYKVAVFAGNSAGYTEYADQPWKTVTMPHVEDNSKATVPKSPIVTISKIEVSEHPISVKVSWVQPKYDNSEIIGYILKYKKQSQSRFIDVNLRLSESSYIISNLENEVYKIKLRAFNHEGTSLSVNETIDLTTYSKQALHKPVSLDQLVIDQVIAAPESETVVHLFWEVSEEVKTFAKFYTIQQQTLNEKPKVLKSTTNSIIIDGLKPFTSYQFSVRAHISESKYGPYCESVPMQSGFNVVNTSPPTPETPAPKIVESGPIDPSTIRLEWSFQGDLPHKYKMLYSDNASHPVEKWRQKEFFGEHKFGEIGGLVSNKEYWFKIAACSDSECGDYSNLRQSKITAILTTESFTFTYYIIAGVVVLFVFLLIVSIVAVYMRKYRNSPGGRPINYNGNGILLNQSKQDEGAKLNAANLGLTTCSETNGVDGDYIPMLTRIHSDHPSTQLDTKGGYPNPRVNGFTNTRCNGIIRPKEMNCYGSNFSSKRMDNVEESERLFPPPGSNRSFRSVTSGLDDDDTNQSSEKIADNISYRNPSKYKDNCYPSNNSSNSATYLIETSDDLSKNGGQEDSLLRSESSNNARSSQPSDGTTAVQ